MKCPYCSEIENKVIDSRLSKDASVIRRRRECLTCNRRFTTYEHIEEIPIMIMKKDGRRELFSREKVRSGMLKACEKRNISMNSIEEFIDEMERDCASPKRRRSRPRSSAKRSWRSFTNWTTWPTCASPRSIGNSRMSTISWPS